MISNAQQNLLPAYMFEPDISPDGWQALLELGFARDNRKTIIKKRKHYGPLRILKPFYPEASGVCHLYLIHPPGGIVGGDSLEINIDLYESSHVLITTPAANKFYLCEQRLSSQIQTLKVANNACLEWLPQETIIFNQARAESFLQVELQGNAQFIGWDIFCFGRPSADETFSHGQFRLSQLITRDGLPIWREHLTIDGGIMMSAPWGMQNKPVMGNMLVTACKQRHLEIVRNQEDLERIPGFSATLVDDVLVIRMLADQSAEVRHAFFTTWDVLRPILNGLTACHPRIWAT